MLEEKGNQMLRGLSLVFVIIILSMSQIVLAEEGEKKQLFDGKTLNGWTQKGGKANYRVENDEIIGTSVPNTSNSFLCTDKNYANFILELEFKVDPRLNSGIQIRSECFDQPKLTLHGGVPRPIPAGRVHGYQVEIDPSERAYTGGIYDESRRGWLKDLKDNEAARKAFRQNEWNKVAHRMSRRFDQDLGE